MSETTATPSSLETAQTPAPPPEAVSPPPAPRSLGSSALVAAACCMLLLLFCLFLYTRQNRFPLGYHPDEGQKVYQVLSGQRQYHEPLLLVEATNLFARVLRVPREAQAVVQAGRGVAALFAALAVVALALSGYRVGGLLGLALCGLAVGLCPALLVHAHYMDTQAALIFGLALTVLAGRLVCDATSPRGRTLSLLFLGIGCGLAASGQYAGLIALAAAIPLALLCRPWTRANLLRLLPLGAGFVLVVAIVNHRALADHVQFREAFAHEMTEASSGSQGMTMRRPNTFFATVLRRECMPQVLVFSLLYIGLLPLLAHRASAWDLFMVLLTLALLGMVACSVRPWPGQALPLVVLLHFLMALGALRLANLLEGRWGAELLVPVIFIALVASTQFPRCFETLRQFRDDSRIRFRNAVVKNLPPGSIIAQDRLAGLEVWPFPRQMVRDDMANFRIYSRGDFAADLGSLEQLRRMGVSYVAVSEATYGPLFHPAVRPSLRPDGQGEEYRRRRQWYEQLFRQHEQVMVIAPPRGSHAFTNPTLRLYRLKGQ